MVEGESYGEVNMVESTHFYMNFPGFADSYRQSYCGTAGIDWEECQHYTEEDMINNIWGGEEKALNTKYTVECSEKEQTQGTNFFLG